MRGRRFGKIHLPASAVLLLLTSAAFLTAITGCESGSGSGTLGLYNLVSVGGHSLPTLMGVRAASDTITLVGGTLNLAGDGSFVSTLNFHHSAVGGTTNEIDNVAGEYRVGMDSVYFSHASTALAVWVMDSSSTVLRGNGFSTEYGRLDSLGALIYHRDSHVPFRDNMPPIVAP